MSSFRLLSALSFVFAIDTSCTLSDDKHNCNKPVDIGINYLVVVIKFASRQCIVRVPSLLESNIF